MPNRTFGALNPQDLISTPPDTVQTLALAANTGQALDWFSTAGSAVANAGTAATHIVRVTPVSTGSVPMALTVNLYSTGAVVPTSGTSVQSSGISHPVTQPTLFQIPGNSTGWSAIALTSGYVMVEQWRR